MPKKGVMPPQFAKYAKKKGAPKPPMKGKK